MLKIIADENIPSVQAFFGALGEVRTVPGRSMNREQVGDADILLVRSVTPVNAGLLEGSRISFVGTCTIGTDHLDIEYLNQKGINYANAPGCNAGGVVQYDLAALSGLDQQWTNKRVGIVGCGNVGSRLLNALQSIGVNCAVYDPFLSQGDCSVLSDFDTVLGCEIICMHVPHTTTGPFPTHHMVGEAELRAMNPGTLLLNAGRGGAIDNLALLEFMEGGGELKLVVDVWENEPAILTRLIPYVNIATSHIAGYSYEGKINGSVLVFHRLLEFLAEKHPDLPFDFPLLRAQCQETVSSLLGPLVGIQASSLNAVIAATCDIPGDDQTFRQAFRGIHSAEEIGVNFDLLRKNYPQRREFSHFELDNADEVFAKRFQSLGFQVGRPEGGNRHD